MRIRSFRWILLFCAAALLLTLYVHIAPALWYNARLQMEFTATGRYPFARGIPSDVAGIDTTRDLLLETFGESNFKFSWVYPLPTPLEMRKLNIYLPRDIDLYASLFSLTPAYTLSAGASLVIEFPDYLWDDTHFYLSDSFPTCRAGFRTLVIHASAAASGKKIDGFFFVRTADIFAMAEALYDVIETYPVLPAAEPLQESVNRLGLSKEDYCRYMVLSPDRYLYDTGKFLSPDLLMQVWDTPAALLLSGSALSLAGFLLVTFRRRNRRSPDAPSKNDLT